MEIDKQIKLLEEQVGGVKDLRNLNHRSSRFTSWKKRTLSHLESIFSEGSEYVRRFEKLTFHEPGFGTTGGSGTSYEDMGGSFVHDLDRAKTILEDGIEALRRLRPPKPKAKTTAKEAPPEEPPPEEPASDDLFFERAILEKTLSEGSAAETILEEDLTATEEVLKTPYGESEPSLEEVIKGSREESEPPLEEVMKSSHEESEPSLRSQAVDEVVRYVSSLLYHYVSLEESSKTREMLQGLRAELDNPKRSKEGIMKALKVSWEEGKDILVDIIARVFAKKE
jgi:hypothetical protein